MRRLAAWTVGAIACGVVVGALARRDGRGGAAVRRAGGRISRKARHLGGRWRGLRYRARRRRPDPAASGPVLADRIRSALGPLEARLDLPHVHVMAEGHTALLHGEVASRGQADRIEAAVAAVPGVAGVESSLHVGLLPGDTRPSEGARHQPPSPALRRLLAAVAATGIPAGDASAALRGVLAAFMERLPRGERRQVLAHLPADVRHLAAAPRGGGRARRPVRTVDELVARVVALDGISGERVRPAVAAVLATLRGLVPEEAADIGAVLPRELERFWREAAAP